MQSIFVLVIALAAALQRDGQSTLLLAPEGPHAVGFWETSIVSDRTDSLAGDPPVRRELLLQVWYPAQTGGEPKPYVSARTANALTTLGLPAGLDRFRSHAARSATPIPGALPLVLMSHGLSWPALLYQSLTEDLASRGYVVAAVTHPHGAAITEYPDGRTIDMSRWPKIDDETAIEKHLIDQSAVWATDLKEALNEAHAWTPSRGPVTLRIDPTRVALVGHSLGGTAAAQALDDPRVRAAVALEGKARRADGTRQPLTKPFMHIVGGYNRLELEGNQYEPAPNVPLYEVIVNGAGHAYFSDFILVYKPSADSAWRERHRYELEPGRIITITRDYIAAFLGRALDGKPHTLLEPVTRAGRASGPRGSRYPEVELKIHVR